MNFIKKDKKMQLSFKNIKNFKLFKPKQKFYSIDIKVDKQIDRAKIVISEFKKDKTIYQYITDSFSFRGENFVPEGVIEAKRFLNPVFVKIFNKKTNKIKANELPNTFVFIKEPDEITNILRDYRWYSDKNSLLKNQKNFFEPLEKKQTMFINILELAKQLSNTGLYPDLYKTVIDENWENYNVTRLKKLEEKRKNKELWWCERRTEPLEEGMKNIIIAQYILKLTQKENLYEVYEMVKKEHKKTNINIVDVEIDVETIQKTSRKEERINHKWTLNAFNENKHLNKKEEYSIAEGWDFLEKYSYFDFGITDYFRRDKEGAKKIEEILNEQKRFSNSSENVLTIIGLKDIYKNKKEQKIIESYKNYIADCRGNDFQFYKRHVENDLWKGKDPKVVSLLELFDILKFQYPQKIQEETLKDFVNFKEKEIKENYTTDVVKKLVQKCELENIFELNKVVNQYLEKQRELKQQQELEQKRLKEIEEKKKKQEEEKIRLEQETEQNKNSKRIKKELGIVF